MAITKWRDRFIAAGRDALQDKLSGPPSSSMEERRLRAEAEQIKLTLAEATMQQAYLHPHASQNLPDP